MAKKFYVIWAGHQTGIFTDWPTCKRNVDKFPNARYKSFKTLAEAEAAFAGKPSSASPSSNARSSTRNSAGSSRKPGTKSAKKGPKTYTAAEVDALEADYKLFTDGGCNPNPGKAGSGIAIYHHNALSELWFGLYNPRGTNNTAELNALHQALLIARDKLAEGRSVVVLCDSQYAIQCLTQWAAGWQKRGWKKAGGEIKNLDIIQPMFTLYQSLQEQLPLLHVNGHVGVEGNELADRMTMVAIEAKESNFIRYQGDLDIPTLLAMQAG
ncbi:ribonuclease HI [Sinobacterium caligoides]|uniref:ribonuclease H n=1 Tax=Sinobacterium caligoides TaxID=933926 RepID=A0A3N2DK93_9GAMM|nr:ribonuclease H family protein [Sinobacterium caligoides]ROS00224.1 ribonuclease HI [Sinobacterium caligoides]